MSLSADDFPPPNPDLIRFDDAEAPLLAVDSAPLLRQRRPPNVLEATDAYFDAEKRRRNARYRWNCARIVYDWYSEKLLDYPRAPRRCFALLVVALIGWLLAPLLLASSSSEPTVRVDELLALADERPSLVTSPPFNFGVRSPSLLGSCDVARLDALARVRDAMRALNATCSCAPMFGVRERLIRWANVDAYNASVEAIACPDAPSIERWYTNESRALARLFVANQALVNAERVRAECVRVDYVTVECRRVESTLDGETAACVQMCADLLDGRYQ